MDGWNTIFLLGRPIFRCYVSFRGCNLTKKYSDGLKPPTRFQILQAPFFWGATFCSENFKGVVDCCWWSMTGSDFLVVGCWICCYPLNQPGTQMGPGLFWWIEFRPAVLEGWVPSKNRGRTLGSRNKLCEPIRLHCINLSRLWVLFNSEMLGVLNLPPSPPQKKTPRGSSLWPFWDG